MPGASATTLSSATRARGERGAVSTSSAEPYHHHYHGPAQQFLNALHSISLRRSIPLAAFSLSLPLVHPARAFAAGKPMPALPTIPGINAPTPPTGGGDNDPSAIVRPIPAAREPIVLTLASFAVTKIAYVRLTKRFRDAYLASNGVDVRFRLTFAGSGVQARAVCDGLPADIVALALALDVQKIADSGLIRADWKQQYPVNSVVCETTVAFVVRPGNPKSITDWEDLVREDVQVVVANPKTAGVARWIFLALWGAKMGGRKGGDKAAQEYVEAVFRNVVVQPRDAREASDVFYKQKVGDVLLTYENEVVLTNQIYGAKALPYIVPRRNVRIECPIALVDKVLDAKKTPLARQAADDFVRFLFTQAAQQEFGVVGFRPNPKLCKTPPAHLAGLPEVKLWSVEKELGGWAAAMRRFFDAGAILDEIQNRVGRWKLEQRKALNSKR